MVFGEYNAITLQQNIDRNIERNVYDADILRNIQKKKLLRLIVTFDTSEMRTLPMQDYVK